MNNGSETLRGFFVNDDFRETLSQTTRSFTQIPTDITAPIRRVGGELNPNLQFDDDGDKAVLTNRAIKWSASPYQSSGDSQIKRLTNDLNPRFNDETLTSQRERRTQVYAEPDSFDNNAFMLNNAELRRTTIRPTGNAGIDADSASTFGASAIMEQRMMDREQVTARKRGDRGAAPSERMDMNPYTVGAMHDNVATDEAIVQRRVVGGHPLRGESEDDVYTGRVDMTMDNVAYIMKRPKGRSMYMSSDAPGELTTNQKREMRDSILGLAFGRATGAPITIGADSKDTLKSTSRFEPKHDSSIGRFGARLEGVSRHAPTEEKRALLGASATKTTDFKQGTDVNQGFYAARIEGTSRGSVPSDSVRRTLDYMQASQLGGSDIRVSGTSVGLSTVESVGVRKKQLYDAFEFIKDRKKGMQDRFISSESMARFARALGEQTPYASARTDIPVNAHAVHDSIAPVSKMPFGVRDLIVEPRNIVGRQLDLDA